MTESTTFQPDWVSPPGDTISDVLTRKHISIDQFALAMERSIEDARALLEGRIAITIAIARKLEELLGASYQFWMNRDRQYRMSAARLQPEYADWLKQFPMADMIRSKWVYPPPRATEEAKALLDFFSVDSVSSWQQLYGSIDRMAAFRTSPTFDSRPGSLAAWLREGERRASSEEVPSWNPDLLRGVLPTIRALTRVGDPQRFLPNLKSLLATAGVAFIPLRPPNGCVASGAARFISDQKALILVSFRYLADDHFWFTLFHEIGHLLLHEPTQFVVDGLEQELVADQSDALNFETSKIEAEANSFAYDTLFPVQLRARLLKRNCNAKDVLEIASEAGIAPGIVVGQLQRIGTVGTNKLNSLKRRYEWAADDTIQPVKR